MFIASVSVYGELFASKNIKVISTLSVEILEVFWPLACNFLLTPRYAEINKSSNKSVEYSLTNSDSQCSLKF